MSDRAGDELDDAYARLAAGEAGATGSLVEAAVAAFPGIVATLQKKHGRIDADAAWDAAVDVVLDLAEGRGGYDPAKRRLFGFVVMAVERDLWNANRGEARRRDREIKAAESAVADGRAAGNDPADEAADRDWLDVRLDEVAPLLDARDAAYLRAAVGGAGDDELARLLGAGDLDADGRHQAVLLARNRVRKRIERAKLIGDPKQRREP